MRVRGPASTNGQDAVQQKDALGGPGSQIAVRRRPVPVGLELAIEIAKTPRKLFSLWNRKGKTGGLILMEIRVLAENHDLDRVERGRVEGLKDVLCRRVEARGHLGAQEVVELRHVLLAELGVERLPARATGPGVPQVKVHRRGDTTFGTLTLVVIT